MPCSWDYFLDFCKRTETDVEWWVALWPWHPSPFVPAILLNFRFRFRVAKCKVKISMTVLTDISIEPIVFFQFMGRKLLYLDSQKLDKEADIWLLRRLMQGPAFLLLPFAGSLDRQVQLVRKLPRKKKWTQANYSCHGHAKWLSFQSGLRQTSSARVYSGRKCNQIEKKIG